MNNDFPNIKNLSDLEKFIRNIDLNSDSGQWDSNDFVEAEFNSKYAYFKIIRNGKEIKTFSFKGNLKNVFFYFEKENNCIKIPAIFSGSVNTERRIGLGIEGNLLFQQVAKYNVSNLKTSSFLKYFGDNFEYTYSYDKIK